jgi:hypothetical protein
MSVGPTFYTRLTTDSTVSGIIGNRVYPEYARESDKTYPLAVYKIEKVTTLTASDGPTGFATCTYTIAAIDQTYKGSSQLADKLQANLDGATWTDSDNNINIQGVFLEPDGRTDEVITQQDSESILYFICQLEFQVAFNPL